MGGAGPLIVHQIRVRFGGLARQPDYAEREIEVKVDG